MGRICEKGAEGPNTGTPRTDAAIAPASVALAAAANLRGQEDGAGSPNARSLPIGSPRPTRLAALNVEKAKADVVHHDLACRSVAVGKRSTGPQRPAGHRRVTNDGASRQRRAVSL
jgi:hypothetical protein